MDARAEAKLFAMLDVISVEVAKIGPLSTKIERVEAKVDTVAIRLAELREETGAGFERIERRFASLETRVEALEERHQGLEAP